MREEISCNLNLLYLCPHSHTHSYIKLTTERRREEKIQRHTCTAYTQSTLIAHSPDTLKVVYKYMYMNDN